MRRGRLIAMLGGLTLLGSACDEPYPGDELVTEPLAFTSPCAPVNITDNTQPDYEECAVYNSYWDTSHDVFCIDATAPCYDGELSAAWEDDSYPTAIAFGNIDADPQDEVAIGRAGGTGTRYWILDDAEHGHAPLLTSGSESYWRDGDEVTSIAFGDVDGDGTDEIAIGRKCGGHCDDSGENKDARYWVLDVAHDPGNPPEFANDLFIRYYGGTTWNGTSRTTALAFGDVDGDGDDELAVGRHRFGANPARYWVKEYDANAGDFDILYRGGQTWNADAYTTALAFGDIDADGTDELAVGRRYVAANPTRYWVKTYNPLTGDLDIVLQGGQTWASDSYTKALAFGDVDGDGTDEIAIGRRYIGANNTRYWVKKYNAPEGNFDILLRGGKGWHPQDYVTAIDLGDVDGDGLDELGVGRNMANPQGEQEPRYWIRDDRVADPTFPVLYEGGTLWDDDEFTRTLAFGSVDADGEAEFGVGRKTSQATPRYWIRDDGLSSFSSIYDTLIDPEVEIQTIKTDTCYSDGDGDGYRAIGALADEIVVTGWERPWVEGDDSWSLQSERLVDCRTLGLAEKWRDLDNHEGYDCDDTEGSVHPRRSERWHANGVDENCDDYDDSGPGGSEIDEAEFIFRVDMEDTSDSLYLEILVPNSFAADLQGELLLTFDELADGWTSPETRVFTHGALQDGFEVTYRGAGLKDLATLTLDGLDPGTIYRIQAGLDCDVVAGTCAVPSSIYYAMTEEIGSNVRAKLVQQALYEYSLSEKGKVGFNAECAVNGWRYTGYETGDEWRSKYRYWCDFLPGHLYDTYLTGMEWNRETTNGPGCTDSFKDADAMWVRSDLYADVAACDSEYQGMDGPQPDQDFRYDGDPDADRWLPMKGEPDALQPGDLLRQCTHTQIFLTYASGYPADDTIWVIESNSGNQIKISSREGNCTHIGGGCLVAFGRTEGLFHGEVSETYLTGLDSCRLRGVETVF